MYAKNHDAKKKKNPNEKVLDILSSKQSKLYTTKLGILGGDLHI